ncbi:MAG: T9SS type A sorting domain-containing protein [Bacteroidetes bacterium]|nr:T9SS type A sorting domain-containing protein [Bacteroidota bacterium]
MKYFYFLLFSFFAFSANAQVSSNVTFLHEGKTVHGTFLKPSSTGIYPTIIIGPGSGANDRDGTLNLTGGNVQCLYPQLLNQTLKIYKQLAEALVDSGYAVLRYDKLEYTYPNNLGAITFRKLWLPVESAIKYIKTRSDVDTSQIILLGHSEGATLIPFIAKQRTDVKALISIAGARTPFDSILAYQLEYIALECNGDVQQAVATGNQVTDYFETIRSNTFNTSTPPLFGVPASEWHEYVKATDPVATNYNTASLPTLFVGLALDFNVPLSELKRFENEVSITHDFWEMAGLNHYMTPNDNPNVSRALTDTIIYWLRQHITTTSIAKFAPIADFIQIKPNPVENNVTITVSKTGYQTINVCLRNHLGQVILQEQIYNNGSGNYNFNLEPHPPGLYFISIQFDGELITKKIIKK